MSVISILMMLGHWVWYWRFPGLTLNLLTGEGDLEGLYTEAKVFPVIPVCVLVILQTCQCNVC